MINVRIILTGLLLFLPLAHAADPKTNLIDWQDWSDTVFDEARANDQFILLDLEAIWCHWCHVMDQKTYSDPAVAEVIDKHYIAVKVDQDSRPDLSERYKAWGWPATIVFAPDGTEIVKRAGYINPEGMRNLLLAIVEDPSPENVGQVRLPENLTEHSQLSNDVRSELSSRHKKYYDSELGGPPSMHKYIDRDSMEYAMTLAQQGDDEEKQRAIQTLDAGLNLIDPAWGGFYQYSVHGNWKNPHFEKIMPTQFGYMRIYALAYGLWQKETYLTAAKAVVRYVDDFLTSPEGAFYTSQDADLIQGKKSAGYFALGDAERRALGIPRVDKNIYARENGWMIEALATLYEFTRDEAYLKRALTATQWIEANRSLPGGGFSHDASDPAGPYLGDTLAMARAYLQLYRVTAERQWLQRSIESAEFMQVHFQYPDGGMATAASDNTPIKPLPTIDENIAYGRYMNLLAKYTGNEQHQQWADHTMRYLATKEVATDRATDAGILLFDEELQQDPIHLTIVGDKNNSSAQQLFNAALDTPGWYKRVEWWDKDEGPLPNPDVTYPQLDKAAAFVCTNNRCSLPIFSADDISKKLAALQ